MMMKGVKVFVNSHLITERSKTPLKCLLLDVLNGLEYYKDRSWVFKVEGMY